MRFLSDSYQDVASTGMEYEDITSAKDRSYSEPVGPIVGCLALFSREIRTSNHQVR